MFLCFCLILTACNFTGSDETGTDEGTNSEGQKDKQILNLIATEELASLDILKEHGVLTVIANSMEGLYAIGKDHQPILAGASDHKVSEDGLVHTFTIRDNKWSNGDPVTAYDYEYSWKRTFREVGYYNYSFADAKILNAQEIMDGTKSPDELGVKAEDEKTLVVTLSEPNPLLNFSMAFSAYFPVNQKFVESVGEDYGQEYDKVLYNGPFVLSDWKHEQGWQFKKNPDYWDADNVNLEEVNVSIVKEESTAVNLYESSKVDAVEISSSFIDRYKEDPNYSTSPTASIRFLRFNHKHEVLSNGNIRRALSFGWDKQALTDVILKNGSVSTYFLVPDIPKLPSGDSFRSLNGDFSGTLEEAQEYWQQGLTELGIESVEVGLLTADETDDKATAEYLKEQWESNFEGLTVNIVLQPFQSRLELEKAIDYDISMSSYTPSTADPLNYLRMWRTGASFNRMDYSNTAYDELVSKAESELDEVKRYEMLAEAERILFEEDAAIIPMYQVSSAIIQRSYVKDLIYHPTIPRYDLRWGYIEGKK
ncbi:peptide ABC transporter substrate-binding protein [Bacillaceae bacterium Marseille-Q3522]|nr:peptide ABC transporter substrate-binding protein [Bacillaceae bacterium Marseille-Q3522]